MPQVVIDTIAGGLQYLHDRLEVCPSLLLEEDRCATALPRRDDLIDPQHIGGRDVGRRDRRVQALTWVTRHLDLLDDEVGGQQAGPGEPAELVVGVGTPLLRGVGLVIGRLVEDCP